MQKENVNVGNEKRLSCRRFSVRHLPLSFRSLGILAKTKIGRSPTETFGDDTLFYRSGVSLTKNEVSTPLSSSREVAPLPSSRKVAPLTSSRKVFIRDIRGAFGGFTLIELLVVVLIISILAAVAVPQYKYAVQKARYMQYVTTAEALYKAQQAFKAANGYYTTDPSILDVDYNARKMRCQFTTNAVGTESGITACGPVSGDTSLPLYGRWLFDTNESRACFSGNSYPHQAEFCKKITGRTSGSVWGTMTIWRF